MPLLTLLRHAKSSWADDTQDDHERPLNDRGIRDAGAVAKELLNGEPVSRVLCSSARRTRQTLQRLLAAGVIEERHTHIEPALYLADAGRIATLVDRVTDDRAHLLVIGHNPGIEALATRLAERSITMKTSSLCRFERADAASAWRLLGQSTPRG